MKKITLLLFAMMISCYIVGQNQEISTTTTHDWNTLRRSGFYESHSASTINAPADRSWLWGINLGHRTNNSTSTANVPYHYGAQILFSIKTQSTMAPEMFIRSTNKEGEGKWAKVIHSEGSQTIDGKLTAEEIDIKIVTGADFVFSPDYSLKPLSEVETFVKENRHLPNIPSEKEMQENGLNLNDMQIKLLQKVEELTLYVIDLKKENEKQNSKIEEQQAIIDKLVNKQ